VPSIDPKLAQVIMREDDNFDFGEPAPARFIEHQPPESRQQPQTRGKAFERRPSAAAKSEPKPASSLPQDVQQTGSAAPAVQDAEFEVEPPMERGKRLLVACSNVNDVADLRQSIAEELAKDEVMLGAWSAACDFRSRELTGSGK
jgi:hypothetical protein